MNKLIFFVDDDKMMLNLVEYTLKNRQDCEINTYQTGEDCLNELDLSPDLIILDHIFEGDSSAFSNGLDILKEIKKKDNSVKVIILSSLNDEKVKSEYLSNGAVRFIEKNDYFIDALMEILDEETAN